MSLLFNLADDWRGFAWKYSALDFTRDSSARKPEWALPVGAIPSVKGSFFSAGRKWAPDPIAALPFGVLISGVAEGEIGVMRQSARFFCECLVGKAKKWRPVHTYDFFHRKRKHSRGMNWAGFVQLMGINASY